MTLRDVVGLIVLCIVLTGTFLVRASHEVADDSSPDVTRADQSVVNGDVRLTLSVTPRPLTALHPFRVRVRAEVQGRSVPLDDARVNFAMAMPMGPHTYSLDEADGWHQATVELPICVSGNGRWDVVVDARIRGRVVTGRFQFALAPPAASTE